MYPHRIHLHGPWECEPLTRTALLSDGRIEQVAGPVPPRSRMVIPCRWHEGGLGPFVGRVRFRRRFHWPGRLDYYERLWLVFEGVDYFARVILNDKELGTHQGAFDSFEFDITGLIRPRNDLTVEVDLPASDEGAPQRMLRGILSPEGGGLWGDVALEVRREAFLRNVHLWATFERAEPELHVAGEVAGEADTPHELYVLLDGRTVRYELLAGGGPFEAVAPTPGVERWQPKRAGELGRARLYEVKIDLVEGGSSLDTHVLEFGFRRIETPDQEAIHVNGQAVEQPLARVDLSAPLSRLNLAEASRKGEALCLKLPLPANLARDEGTRAEALRQVRVIVAGLQANPCIVGWLCETEVDESFAGALRQSVGNLDPTRPFWVGGSRQR